MADQIMVNSLEFKKELKKKCNVNAICIYNPLNTKEIIKIIYNKNIAAFTIINLR